MCQALFKACYTFIESRHSPQQRDSSYSHFIKKEIGFEAQPLAKITGACLLSICCVPHLGWAQDPSHQLCLLPGNTDAWLSTKQHPPVPMELLVPWMLSWART